jgi:hypothetical protein
MQTLSELSRTLPDENELREMFAALETESDRGCALIAGSLLENILATTLQSHFADCGEAFRKKLFEGADAPLSTFSAKIKLGRALAIYDQQIQSSFEKIKDIRNAFAHSLKPLSFEHPSISAHVKALHPSNMPKAEGNLSAERIRYASFCLMFGRHLWAVANERGGAELEIPLTMPNSPSPEQSE